MPIQTKNLSFKISDVNPPLGFIPNTVEMTLTPTQARTLRQVADGFISDGQSLNSPVDGLKSLLDALRTAADS